MPRPKVDWSWKPSIALSQASNGMIRPTRWRSSGTWPMPRLRTAWGSLLGGLQRPAVDEDLAAGERPDAGERLEQFRLAVAGDAGDAEDLALAQDERDVVRRASTPRSSRTTRLRASSATLPGWAGPLSILRMTLRPTIASASSGGEVCAVSNVATISPRRITETRSVRLMISRSLWVMKRIVLFWLFSTLSISNSWSASAGVSTAVGSSSTRISAPRTSALRISTRCCRPTESSPTIASGSTSSPYSAPSSASRLRMRRRALGEQRPAFGAEHDVLEHAERLHQHEMLVDHADAAADRLARRADAHRLAVDADFAGVGLVEAVEDRHQRRLAGAVFADDAVDDAALDLEIDVGVGVDRTEALVDADQLDGRAAAALAGVVTTLLLTLASRSPAVGLRPARAFRPHEAEK